MLGKAGPGRDDAILWADPKFWLMQLLQAKKAGFCHCSAPKILWWQILVRVTQADTVGRLVFQQQYSCWLRQQCNHRVLVGSTSHDLRIRRCITLKEIDFTEKNSIKRLLILVSFSLRFSCAPSSANRLACA